MKTKPSTFDVIITIILVAICCVLAIAIALNLGGGASRETQGMPGRQSNMNQSQMVNVSVEQAGSGSFSKTTRINGEIGSEGEDIDILPDIGGKITEILVKKGDAVQAGDTIAMVDPSKPGAQYKASAVVSPVGGTVSAVKANEGETVTTNTAIVQLAGDRNLKITARIPEKYLGTLQDGMSATFTTVAWPDRAYTGTLTYIAPTVSTTNRTVDIELNITGDTTGLKEGMYVSLDLITERIDDCITIPTSALSTFLNDKIVYVVENGVAKRRVVQTGSANDTRTVILSGVQEGDLIITVGSVNDGVSVNVLE
ncbi:MAG: efflux RND transporter periplasmic adaptor subunit [Sphaerochaetaceae bacterium]|nr:efflux RND transporter periplasmic adaptor subunit [Sphaerochaetaceae bacterium]